MNPAPFPDEPDRSHESAVDDTANVTQLRISAHAQDSVVIFSFFHPSGRPCGPAWISVEEAETKTAFWSLSSNEPQPQDRGGSAPGGTSGGSWTGLRAFRYGVVPSGYRQTFPENGPPALLSAGVTYRVSAYGSRFGDHLFTV